MKNIFIWLMFLFSALVIAQETVKAEKEILGKITLGDGASSVQYFASEEGFFSPGSPFVDERGRLIFGSRNNDSMVLIYSEGKFISFDKLNTKRPIQVIGAPITSQKGIGTVSSKQFLFVKDKFLTYNFDLKENSFNFDSLTRNYPSTFGAILYSERNLTGIAVVIDVKNPSEIFSIIPQENIKTWLSTQPGGFSIGDDGLLYRNGMLWSALPPKDKTHGWQYLGRLASGHAIWCGGGNWNSPKEFLIADSKGNIEMILDASWMADEDDPSSAKKQYQYNFGLGPWGELYCLLPPEFILLGGTKDGAGGMSPVYEPDPKGSAELVVVRNHLKFFGRLNDGGVRLRKDPTTAGEILGTFPAKTGFRILQKGTKEETIGGQKNVWYKVRLLDGTEGWFFGSFVHNLYDGPNGNPPPWPNVPDW